MGCMQPKPTIKSLHNQNNPSPNQPVSINHQPQQNQLPITNDQQHPQQLNAQHNLTHLQGENNNITNQPVTSPLSPLNKNNKFQANDVTFGADPNHNQKDGTAINASNNHVTSQLKQQSHISQNQINGKPQTIPHEPINLAGISNSKIIQKHTYQNPISEVVDGVVLEMPSKIGTSYIPSNIDEGFLSFNELDRMQREQRLNNPSIIRQDEQIHEEIEYLYKIPQINFDFQVEIK